MKELGKKKNLQANVDEICNGHEGRKLLGKDVANDRTTSV